MKRQWCFDVQPWVDICPPLSVPSKVHLWCTCTFIPSITWPFLSSDWSRAQLHLLPIGQDMHSADHLSWTKKRVDKREGSAVHSTLQEGRFKQLVKNAWSCPSRQSLLFRSSAFKKRKASLALSPDLMMMVVVMVIKSRKETMIAAGSAMMVDGWSLPCSPHYNHCIFALKHSAALAEKFPSKVVSLASNFYPETSSVSCRYQISNHLHCNSISRSSSSHILRLMGNEIILPW